MKVSTDVEMFNPISIMSCTKLMQNFC